MKYDYDLLVVGSGPGGHRPPSQPPNSATGWPSSIASR